METPKASLNTGRKHTASPTLALRVTHLTMKSHVSSPCGTNGVPFLCSTAPDPFLSVQSPQNNMHVRTK